MNDRSEILFLAMTRPAMMWGAPIEGVMANLGITVVGGMFLSGRSLMTSPFVFWLAFFPIHYIMRKMISKDFHAFRTVRLWAMTLGAGITTLESLPTRRPTSGKRCASSV